MKTAASWVGTEETFGKNKNVPLAAQLTYGAMQQQYKQWHSGSRNLVQLIHWWRKSLVASVTTRAQRDSFALDGREMNLKPMHRICKQQSLEIHRSSVTNFPFVLSSTLSWARLNFNLFFLFFFSKQGIPNLSQNRADCTSGVRHSEKETPFNFLRDPSNWSRFLPSFGWQLYGERYNCRYPYYRDIGPPERSDRRLMSSRRQSKGFP